MKYKLEGEIVVFQQRCKTQEERVIQSSKVRVVYFTHLDAQIEMYGGRGDDGLMSRQVDE